MTMPKFEPVAFVQSDPDGNLHLAEITKTETCQNLDQWDKQVGWKAVPLHTEDQLTEAYEAGKRDAVPEGWVLVPKEPVGAVLVRRESREGVMFYSNDMIPDPSTIKDRFELITVYAPKGEEL